MKPVTVPLTTLTSLASNPVTAPLKVTVNGIGLELVGFVAVLATPVVVGLARIIELLVYLAISVTPLNTTVAPSARLANALLSVPVQLTSTKPSLAAAA